MHDNTADFITKLYSTYHDDLIKHVLRQTDDYALAEDLVHSTMEVALKKIKKVQRSASPKGWLLKTLDHKMKREWAKAYRKRETGMQSDYIIDQLGLSPEDMKPLTLAGLDEILPDCCPEQFREILCLRHVEQLQYKEIGKRLGISAGAAQQRLFKAQQWLKDYFERHDMPDGTQRTD